MVFRVISSLPFHTQRLVIALTLLTLALFVAAWLAWYAVSRGVLSRARCPHCGSERIRPSLFRQADDLILRWFFLAAFRCETRGQRHFNVRWAVRRPADSLPPLGKSPLPVTPESGKLRSGCGRG